MEKKQALNSIDKKSEIFTMASDTIWDNPETGFTEFKATEIICKILTDEGFTIKKDLSNIKTAFSGSYGNGKPIIGILGEYDALSSMSQQANIFEYKPLGKNVSGHGCGHNLLGIGSVAAAVGVKEYLKENKIDGTVIFYGCPAEEGGSGKAFMARDGIFDDLDAAITWHPGDVNAANSISTNANFKINYKFKGVSAHAAACPHLGRSALDGVEIMNIGVQFLREHIVPEARIHYAIVNAGGKAANVVQSQAEVAYIIRAPKLAQLRDIKKRVDKIAEGAAHMTETEMTHTFLASSANVVPNDIISDIMAENLIFAGIPTYTEEEKEYAGEIIKTLSTKTNAIIEMVSKLGEQGAALTKMFENKTIFDFAVPNIKINYTMPSSSDVGDVSWICPTSQIMAATMAGCTPNHSWQRTAQGKSSIAHKGMLYAGRVMAGTVIDMITNPELVEKAKKEHLLRLNNETYFCDIPIDGKPTPMESDE